jgi:hypothetical protein
LDFPFQKVFAAVGLWLKNAIWAVTKLTIERLASPNNSVKWLLWACGKLAVGFAINRLRNAGECRGGIGCTRGPLPPYPTSNQVKRTMPISPEYAERIREPPPSPFVNWSRAQRLLFAWGCVFVWILLVGTVAIFLVANAQLPACVNSHFIQISMSCRTGGSIALLLFTEGLLFALYFRFILLISRIAYFPRYPSYDDEA